MYNFCINVYGMIYLKRWNYIMKARCTVYKTYTQVLTVLMKNVISFFLLVLRGFADSMNQVNI